MTGRAHSSTGAAVTAGGSSQPLWSTNHASATSASSPTWASRLVSARQPAHTRSMSTRMRHNVPREEPAMTQQPYNPHEDPDVGTQDPDATEPPDHPEEDRHGA